MRWMEFVALLNACIQLDANLEKVRRGIEVLNEYYVEVKNPPDMPLTYPKDEAREAVEWVEDILQTLEVACGA